MFTGTSIQSFHEASRIQTNVDSDHQVAPHRITQQDDTQQDAR